MVDLTVLEFELALKFQSINIKGLDGVTQEYLVCEMTGTQLEEYLNSMKDRVIMDGGRVVGMKQFNGMYTSLLARTTKRSDGSFVPLAELDKWPASLQKKLFKIAQTLNDLDDEAGKRVGNA
jgi:hypothetical protein